MENQQRNVNKIKIYLRNKRKHTKNFFFALTQMDELKRREKKLK